MKQKNIYGISILDTKTIKKKVYEMKCKQDILFLSTMNVKIDLSAMKSAEASMAHYNNNNIINKNSIHFNAMPWWVNLLLLLFWRMNERTNEIKNSYFIQLVTLFGGSFAFQTASQPTN